MTSAAKKRRKFLSSKETSAPSLKLDPQKLPAHVAIIMDGNGRWARKRLLNRVKGHEQGAETVRSIVRACREVGIRVLTLYAFSTENWERPKAEIAALMTLLRKFLESEKAELLENGIRLTTIGETERLPAAVQQALSDVCAATADLTDMTLNLALSYGGRSELVHMARQVAEKAARGELAPEAVDQDLVAGLLYTRGLPDPDLLIRTSGEMRISNFLLWQVAYAEIFVTDTLWPDFSREELIDILRHFQQRERRFGKIKAEDRA
jgi:undecaprenyl diphosphate synthase